MLPNLSSNPHNHIKIQVELHMPKPQCCEEREEWRQQGQLGLLATRLVLDPAGDLATKD